MSGTGESPKVLRVSFGSFSCTLEGFDDPVQTLFAVAEHFRDLSGRDPGFALGTRFPDAATLARQVEAAGGGTGAVRVEPMPEAVRRTREESTQDEIEAADLVRVVAAVAESANAVLAEEGRAGSGRFDIERLAAAMAATRRGSPAGAVGEAPSDEEAAVAAIRVPEPRVFHDWGDDEDELAGDRPEAPPSDEGEEAEAGLPLRAPSPGEGAGSGRRLLSAPPDQDEEGLRRILSQAERQLADPGVARRREAMAHLKAAVAATEAQRALGGDVVRQADAAEPFREEWAAAARPQAGRSAPPPLRLVASQRVEEAPEAGPSARPEERPAAEPVLRPVAEAPEPAANPIPAPAAPAASFAAFASQAGATASLPDLLEAAASWLKLSQGEEEVSRSQLLRLAAEVLPEPPNREDALRIFGSLLRQGRLSRVEGGRFRIGAETRFGPARHAV